MSEPRTEAGKRLARGLSAEGIDLLVQAEAEAAVLDTDRLAPTIKIAANGCQATRAGKHEWEDQCLRCGSFLGEHPDDHLPETTTACYRCGRIKYHLALYPASHPAARLQSTEEPRDVQP